MAAGGRKEGVCDLSNVVAFGHNEQWLTNAAKVVTMLAKISPNGNNALTFVLICPAVVVIRSTWQ